eukprot:GEMP01048319.1.p1 GENE.GEMP01048319.1~~GEMP01048319.1.p1  ORF type:complete len:242 (+),score=45.70 GEMP01048319.1:722-1447(+)
MTAPTPCRLRRGLVVIVVRARTCYASPNGFLLSTLFAKLLLLSSSRRRSHRLQTLESFLQLNTHSDYVALSDIEKELSSELEYMRPEDLPTPLQYFLLPASPIQPIKHRELTDPIENQMVWMAPPDALNFEHPIERLDGCAGGTASFFALRYAAHCMPHYIHSDTFWVGKDLSHAENENEFYSELRTFVLDECADKAWRDLALQWCCACAGVLEAPVFPLKCPLDLDSYSTHTMLRQIKVA